MDGFCSLFLSPPPTPDFLGNVFLAFFFSIPRSWGWGRFVSSIKDAIFSQLVPTNSVPRSAASAPLQLTTPPSPRSLASARRVAWIGQRKQTTGGRAAGEGKAKDTEPTAWLHAPPWFAGIAVADWTIGAPLPSPLFFSKAAQENCPSIRLRRKKKKLALSCHPHILQPSESAAFAMAICRWFCS